MKTTRPRRAATKRARPATAIESDADASDFEETRPKPAKRARRGKNVKTRASIEKLTEMPLDFIYLLVCKLHPLDLLHMARSCKNLRQFFMSRGSAPFWQAAARNVDDLPPLPEGLSWPAYVAFMFSTICQNCGKNGCEGLVWDCLARYCSGCKKKLSVLHSKKYGEVRTLESALPDSNIPYPLSQLPLHCLVPVMDTEKRKFEDDGILRHLKYNERWDYSKIVIDRLRNDLSKLPREEIYGYIERQATRLRTLREQTPQLVQWKEDDRVFRAEERQQMQDERCESIKEKLIDLGWGPELERMGGERFRAHHLVAQPKPLTDRIWKSIKPQVESFMLNYKHDRLIEENRDLFNARLLVLSDAVDAIQPPSNDTPSMYHIALGIPQIRSTFELPRNTTINTASFNFLATELPPFIKTWKDATRKQLCSLISAKVKLAKSADPLSLAVGSAFKCKHCGMRGMRHPNLLNHRCYKRPVPAFEERDYYKELLVKLLPTVPDVEADFEAEVEVAELTIRLCGQEPKSASIEQMDSSPVRLTCAAHNNDGEMLVMTWTTMLQHYNPGTCSPKQIQVLSDDQCEAAKPLEEKARELEDLMLAKMTIWQCALCSKVAGRTKASVMAHLKSEHSIDSPSEDEMRRTDARYTRSVKLLDESMRVKLTRMCRPELEAGLAAFVKV